MIVVRLMGGLGNQMFQYAAGRRLAGRHKTKLLLDRSWYGQYQSGNDVLRSYELDCFSFEPHFASQRDVGVYTLLAPTSLWPRAKRKLGIGLQQAVTQGDGVGFDPSVLDAPDNSLLAGLWQSEKYFADIEKILRKDFRFKLPQTGRNKEMARLIKSVSAVSLHVRRGDYVSTKSASAYQGAVPLAYYKQAVEKISRKLKNPHFFVISDDPKWCKENLKLGPAVNFVDHNPVDKGFEDLRLMSQCKHHIIANSSFSWWGAWLNPSPNKIVYTPKRWFKEPTANSKDIVPDSWIKL